MNMDASTPNFLTVRQFTEKHLWMTEGTLRKLLFYRRTNGFDRCVRYLGTRILLNEEEVLEWVNRQRESSAKGVRV